MLAASIYNKSRFVRNINYNNTHDHQVDESNFRESEHMYKLYKLNKFLITMFYIKDINTDIDTRLKSIYIQQSTVWDNRVENFTKKQSYINNLETKIWNYNGEKYFNIRNNNNINDKLYLIFNARHLTYDYIGTEKIFKNMYRETGLTSIRFNPDIYIPGSTEEEDEIINIKLVKDNKEESFFNTIKYLEDKSSTLDEKANVYLGFSRSSGSKSKYKQNVNGVSNSGELQKVAIKNLGKSNYIILNPNKYYKTINGTYYNNRIYILDANYNYRPMNDPITTSIIDSPDRASKDGSLDLEVDGSNIYAIKMDNGVKKYFNGGRTTSNSWKLT